MWRGLLKFVESRPTVLLAVGAAPWVEAVFTVQWAVPYCSSQVDGPAWPATGFPLPYQIFGGASSLEYFFMPHLYLLDLAAYAGLLLLTLRAIRPDSKRAKQISGLCGAGLGLCAMTVMILAMNARVLQPVATLGNDSYGRYREYRPVGLSLFHHPRKCPKSDFWFPDGWHPR